ncbi:MAG: diadenylate cyclase CdaA [Clostridia bacterium]|nr:diadenylate cyclase CdaA [Clostridia bacterium]
MVSLWDQVENFIWNIFHRPTIVDLFDILIITFLLYRLFRMIQRTRAIQVFKGVVYFILIHYISTILGFKTLSWLMKSIIDNGAIALLILFQPELRRGFEQLGRGARIDRHHTEKSDTEHVIDELTRCLIDLAKRRVGALIVIEGKTGLQDVMETGTNVDALISAALLENIFEPNTPLHDGAVILRAHRVASAACVLTLSDSQAISSSLGTRHRAGLGISETTDATVLIVSEETGIISMCRAGKMTRYLDEQGVREVLGELYREDKKGSSFPFFNLRRKKGEGGKFS